ncbi:MAG: hypothetical protein ACTSVY_06390 [Candidatus Helarchaeota archaeon]
MGRGKTVLGLLSILVGEFLIFLFIQPSFITDLLQSFTPLSLMQELVNSMTYLIWIFLILGIILIGGGIYAMVQSKLGKKSKYSGETYYSSY